MPSYPVVEVEGPPSDLELALAVIQDWGCLGAEELAASFRAFFPESTDAGAVASDLRNRIPGISVREAEPQPVQDWLAAWKESFTGFALGESAFVLPTWLPSPSTGRSILRIDPEQAFGTGAHDTTRLAATLVERLVRPGDRVIDLGTGTGILAMVAALRGARSAIAIEPDEDAAGCCRENLSRNGLRNRVQVEQASCEDYEKLEADLIVANIIRPVLEEALPRMDAPILILSGLLADEVDDFVGGFLGGVRATEVWTSGEWAAVVARK